MTHTTHHHHAVPAGVLAMRGYGAARVWSALSALGAFGHYVPTTIVDLARLAGVHRNTARAALKRLTAAGFAHEKPGQPGYWRVQRYDTRGK